jgi:hypothetical protein
MLDQARSRRALVPQAIRSLRTSGPVKRRRTKRSPLSNSISLPTVNHASSSNFQTMLETLIYIVQEINLEQVKLTTTINQLSQRVHQNESYLNQLNTNIETLYEQFQVSACRRRPVWLERRPVPLRSNSIPSSNSSLSCFLNRRRRRRSWMTIASSLWI